jgi:membrane protease YdiL (CAAX protease family)
MSSVEPATTEPDRPGATPYWIALAAVLIGFAGGIFVTIFVQLIGSAFGSPATNPTPAVNITGDFLFDGAFVASALYFTVPAGWMGTSAFGYRRIPLWAAPRWRTRAWMRTGVWAVVLSAFAYYVLSFSYGALVNVHGTDRLPSDLGVKTSTAAAIGVGVFVCAVAPMAEEFFFRGFLFGVLRRMRVVVGGRELGPWLAAVIVGLLFGLAHYDSAQPQFLVPLGFLGFVLCVLRWKTGSLYPCMALHSINNCIALGVNELGWSFGEIVLLTAAALALIAAVTGPLSRRAAAG